MSRDEEEIRQLVATWMSASKSGDTATVLSLMSDDVVFLLTGRPPMIGKAAFAAAAQSQPGQAAPKFDGTSEIHEVHVVGDFAYLWTSLTVKVTFPDGKTMTRAGNTLSVLKKLDGKWVLTRDANMLAPVATNA